MARLAAGRGMILVKANARATLCGVLSDVRGRVGTIRPERASSAVDCQGAGFGSSDDLSLGRLTRLPCIPPPRGGGMEPFGLRRRAQSSGRPRRVGAIAEVERACS